MATFFEGWRLDLRLDQASAFVVMPDGKTYAAMLTPQNNVATYRPNDTAVVGKIRPETQAMMVRFENVKLDIPCVTK